MKRSEAIAYLTSNGENDHLGTPCSRYGRNAAECAPVAYRAAYLYCRELGQELDQEYLDYVMGLVVNDHADIAYIVKNYGHRHYR